jgi:hypothetical protein
MRSIQNFSVASVAFLFALLAQVIPAHADNEKLDFTLMNKTGYGIKAVYIAPSDSTEWGDNLISQPLENGDGLAITFDPKATAEKWDIKIEWVDEGDPVTWKSYKLSDITKITLHYDRKTDETTAETE